MCAHVHNHLLLRCCSCEEEKHIVHHLYSLHLSLRDHISASFEWGSTIAETETSKCYKVPCENIYHHKTRSIMGNLI